MKDFFHTRRPSGRRKATKNRAKWTKASGLVARPQRGGVREGPWARRAPARIASQVRCAAQDNARPLAPPAGARARPFSRARSFRGELRSSAFVTNDVPRLAAKAAWLFEPLKSSAAGSCPGRSEEHTSELQSLMRNSYAVFCLQKK